MENTLTISQIVELGKSLDPNLSLKNPNADFSSCVSQVFTKVVVDGEIVELEHKQGKYAAIYVRVSTMKQAQDGWSVQEQLTRNISLCVKHKQTFRIFSDASMSGGLPYKNDNLIYELASSKALRYKESFEAIFLDESNTFNLTVAERQDMKIFLQHKINDIINLKDKEDSIPEEKIDVTGNRTKIVMFRPALTVFMNSLDKIHTLYLTDLSRLARSLPLSTKICQSLSLNNVNIIGSIESLSFLNVANSNNSFMGMILSHFNEIKLKEAVSGFIRGIAVLLSENKSHGTLPFWLQRKEDGSTELVEHNAKIVRKIVELYLSDDNMGYMKIASELDNLGMKNEIGNDKQTWYVSTIRSILVNPSLYGVQEIFGKQWQVYEPVITEHEFNLIQKRMADRLEVSPKKNVTNTQKLLTGILRCKCGKMAFFKNDNGIASYFCNPEPAFRKLTNITHLRFKADDAERFFSDLVKYHHRSMIQKIENSDMISALKTEITQLEERLTELEKSHNLLDTQAETQAVQFVKMMNIKETSANYTTTLKTMKHTVLIGLFEEEDNLKSELTAKRKLLQKSQQVEKPLSVTERVENWNTLTDKEQNSIMRQLIQEATIIEEDGNEYLRITLNNLDNTTLPYAKINIKQWGTKRHRTLPTVQEYFSQAFSL